MPLTQTTITISNVDPSDGLPRVERVRANLRGPIRRSVGAGGDPISVVVEKSDWPAGFDDLGEFHININEGQGTNNQLIIKGYRLRSKMPVTMGGDPSDSEAPIVATQLAITFVAALASRRDGLGGLLTEGTLNMLDSEGLVDIADPAYKTNQDLVDLCLDAIGLPHIAASASLDVGISVPVVFAPGPLDWGNARPLSELESILTRIGWTIVQLNDGRIAARRLLRAGEPIEIPEPIEDLAEPYELSSMPGIRSNKIIITSGTTRSTIITTRSLGSDNPLEWVIFDPATNTWGDQPVDALELYRAGLKGADITPEASKQIGQLYRAVRLSGEDLTQGNLFVNIPTAIDYGELLAFAGAPGVVEAACCIKMGGDQLRNVPTAADSTVRIDGLRAISGQGVLVLPTDAEFVRVESTDTGRRGDVRELTDDELVITYAHEANTGVFKNDYFVAGFEWEESEGEISIEALPFSETDTHLDDPEVVKVGLPILRQILTATDESPDPTLVAHNSEQLVEIAKLYASARIGDAFVQSGPIVLRGIVDVDPGDFNGALTAITWDPTTHTTVLSINQHETPGSFYEQLQRAAGNSIASGVGSVRLGRSSAALSDIRNTLTSSESSPGGSLATPESNPKLRGRTESLAGIQGSQDSGLKARQEIPTVPEQSVIYAKLTSSTSIGTNKFQYEWEEVKINDGSPVTTGSKRSSATHGKARNLREMLNTGAGVQGNGINVTNLRSGFTIQPISPSGIVELRGPFPGTDPLWFFESFNAVDGVCPS